VSHLGVDLSNYNTNLNYSALHQAEVEFAYILMTDGDDFRDALAITHVQGCEAAGIAWGGYHFLRPSPPNGLTIAAQSVYFINYLLAMPARPQLPSACDVETEDPAGWAHLSSTAAEWMSNVEGANSTPNDLCVLYTNVNFAQNMPGWPLSRPAWLADPSNVAPQLSRLITQTGQQAFPSNPTLDVDEFVGTEAQWSAFVQQASPNPQPGEPMAQSEIVSFKPGQLDTFQVAQGTLWHKWGIGGQWTNEAIPHPAGVSFVGEPKVSIVGGGCWVTAEDSTGREWAFVQAASEGVWNNVQLP
jgi:GH25 family lysozyme M1 (1,4-beta-N-acetylmuramidase)